MKLEGILVGVGTIAATSGLAACTQSVPVEQSERSEGAVILAPPISTVKPGASVTFSADGADGLSAGNTGTVTVSIHEGYPSGVLTVTASTKTGISLVGNPDPAQFDMASGTTHTWKLDIAAEADGVHYVNLLATVSSENGFAQSRAYSVRVEVGDWKAAQAEQEAAKTIETMSDGQRAVIMPAEETTE